MTNFGKYIQALRQANGMSLRQAERQCGVSNAYISQIERGLRSAPSPAIIRKMAMGYGVAYKTMMWAAGHL